MKTIFYLLPKLAINITCAYTMYKSQDYWKMSKHITSGHFKLNIVL